MAHYLKQYENAMKTYTCGRGLNLKNFATKLTVHGLKKCRGVFFRTKVNQLKYSKPNQWWKSVKSLCGMDPVSPSNNFDNLLSSTEANPSNSNSLSALANSINQAFLAPMASFQPLTSEAVTFKGSALPISPDSVTTEYSVFSQLAHLKTSKAPGPDGLPSWLLKENADTLAKPVSDIINASYSENRLPLSWKKADVAPIAKQRPVLDVCKHLRPISLTPILCCWGNCC